MAFETSHTEVEARFLGAALSRDARVLDAGCGRRTRLSAYRSRIAELVGIDLDSSAGRENQALDRFLVADARRHSSRLPRRYAEAPLQAPRRRGVRGCLGYVRRN